jgi:hypothetical protein
VVIVDGGECRFSPLCAIHDGSRWLDRETPEPPKLKGPRPLSELAVREIRTGNETARTYAERYGVTIRTIVRVRNGHTYTEEEYR